MNEIADSIPRIHTPEGRALLKGHALFFLHCSRVLRSGHLQDTDGPWRTIECIRADIEFTVLYSRINGCMVSAIYVGDRMVNDGGLGRGQLILSIPDRKFESLPIRMREWKRMLAKQDSRLDFQQRVLFRALLHGYRQPLRKGRSSSIEPNG